MPIGPLLNFEDGLNPSTGSALFARSCSISPIDFMFIPIISGLKLLSNNSRRARCRGIRAL
mgnify:CR=1 FL=1